MRLASMTEKFIAQEAEQAMQNRITEHNRRIDRATSASIRHAIGERLRQNMRTDDTSLPSHLQNLLDEMERQDRANAAGTSET